MKKLLILHILLCLFGISYAQISTTNSLEQPRRIGYTTNYGYSFQATASKATFRSVNTYSTTSRYRTSGDFKNINRYNYSNNIKYYSNNVYSPTGNRYSPVPSRPIGPRKSKERPFSGNFLEDLTDWWRMNTDNNWPSYVDDDYWEEFLSQYPEYEDDAREWFEEHGQHFPGDPEDPFGDPLGDDLMILCIMVSFYFIYQYIKTKTASV